MSRTWLLVVAVVAGARTAEAAPEVTLGYETGPAYIAQNDGRYGVDGTAYTAADVGQQDNLARVERTWLEIAFGRHRAVLLYAPFELTTRFTLADDLRFRDTLFPAGTVVDHRYLFDGYRASYLYRVVDGALAVDVGGSLQIRNADVAFGSVDGALYDAQDDIGLVAAAKARARWSATDTRWAELEVDALSTFGLIGDVSGAIYDVALSAGQAVTDDLDLVVTARLLGGGADVPDQAIDNFANFVSATVGVRIALDGF